MGPFPFLITLFLFTAVAALAFGARSWERAENAPDETDSKKPSLRMAAQRSRTGELMSDLIDERDQTT